MSELLPAGVDRSGVTVVGAKDLAVANIGRRGLSIQNISDTTMVINETGSVATATNGYQVVAGAAVEISTNQRVSVYCASADKAYIATEV